MSEIERQLLKALIIEDDRVSAITLRKMLEKSPLSLKEISSANLLQEGLKLAKEARPDVIFLDLNLPDSNELETVKRARKACPHQAIIVVTSAEADVGAKSIGKGVQEYLQKGEYDVKTLTKTVQYALERKKSEQALKESELRYRMLFEEAQGAIFIADTKTKRIADCNKAATELLERKRAEILGEPFTILNRYAIKSEELFEEAARKKDNFFLEHQVITKSGKVKNVTINSKLFEIDHKKMLQLIFRDITKQRKTEEAFRREQNKAQMYLDTAGVIMLVLDGALNVKLINEKGCRLLGYQKRHIIGKNWCENFIPEQFREKEREILSRFIHGETGRYEYNENPVLTKDGKERLIAWHNVPLYDESGNLEAILSSGEDITRQKRAEEDLLVKTTLLEAQSETAIDGFLAVNDEGKTILSNKRFRQMWNIPEEVLKRGEDEEMLQNVRSQLKYPDKFLEGVKYLYNHKDEESRDEIELNDGRVFDRYSSPLLDKIGKYHGRIWFFHDITKQKQAEEAKSKAYCELEKAHEKLKEMQGQLVQNEKMASIGQLSAGIAHEMNSPVGFVDSNFHTLEKYTGKIIELLELYKELASAVESGDNKQSLNIAEKVKGSSEALKMDFILEDIEELFKESKDGLNRVTKIIKNLKDFSRIDQAEEFDEYDINEGVKSTLVMAKNEVKYNCEIVEELAEVPMVKCNSGQINQVFLNTIVNAAQAISSQNSEGKGTIKIKTYADEENVICEIIDDGPGIPKDKISKVFDPFFTTKEPGKGTGLGLSISYDIIVNKHNGQLLVESSPGKGSKFTIKIPKDLKQEDVNNNESNNKEEMLENEKTDSIIR